MSKNKKWIQIGNFLIGEEKNATGRFVVLKAGSGIWSVRWREDTIMYGMVKSLVHEEAGRAYLASLITVMYSATTHVHDLVAFINEGEMPFLTGFMKLIKSECDLEMKYAPHEDNDENKIIKEERERHELFEDLMKEEKDNDGYNNS